MEKLDLRDAVLVGHSMGTGDVARYLGRYGSGRVRKAVLVSPILPYLRAATDNPVGVPVSMFEGFTAAAKADRPSWLKGFLDNFYNMDVYGGTKVTDQAFQASFNITMADPRSPRGRVHPRPGRQTSAPMSRASTFRSWSSRATRTAVPAHPVHGTVNNRKFSVERRYLLTCDGIAIGLTLRDRWMPGEFVADLQVEFNASCGYP